MMPLFPLELPCSNSKDYVLLVLVNIIDSKSKKLVVCLKYIFLFFLFESTISIKIKKEFIYFIFSM